MPTDWIPPAVFCVATTPDGKKYSVYHIYKNDDFQCGARQYWYTFNITNGDDSGSDPDTFDVRNLKTYTTDDQLKEAVLAAVASGELCPTDMVDPDMPDEEPAEPTPTLKMYERRAANLWNIPELLGFVQEGETQHALINGAKAGEPPAEISHRYHIVKTVPDDLRPEFGNEVVGVNTLEEACDEILNHILSDGVEDSDFDARVFDLNTGKEIKYRTIHKVQWLPEEPQAEEASSGDQNQGRTEVPQVDQ